MASRKPTWWHWSVSSAPEGYARGSLRLLADRVVQLKIINSISHETVRQVLDDNELKPWRREEWCIPMANADFVFHMEDVLDVYKRPVDPKRPVVCFDESPEQLVSETRQALPMAPEQLEKYDYEYRREGVANLFMFFAPLQNWRNVKVTERRTKVDWADCMRDLVDVHFPQAEKIVIVQDQLNTHSPACLYDVFAPAEAKRILDQLEFHSTAKHGSWLNMAEIELSVLNRQCLKRCIPSQASLIDETEAWTVQRNNKQATVNGQFATEDARIKLERLYPAIHDGHATSIIIDYWLVHKETEEIRGPFSEKMDYISYDPPYWQSELSIIIREIPSMDYWLQFQFQVIDDAEATRRSAEYINRITYTSCYDLQ